MAVEAEELIKNIREYFGPDGARVERTFRVAWEDRLTFMKEKLGYLSGGVLYAPDKYVPEGNESIGNLYARQARILPFGDTSNDPNLSWKTAYVEITYTTSQLEGFARLNV